MNASPRIVVDTCVFIAALRSRRGASFKLLSLVGTGRFDLALSVALVLEHEEVAVRHLDEIGIGRGDLDAILDYLCAVAHKPRIHFLWRPVLPDPGDDMVLELAVAARCNAIVTFNLRDFRGSESLGVRAITPQQFLTEPGVLT